MPSVKVSFDLFALDAAVDALEQRLHAAARPAAQAAAQVLYDRVQRNVSRLGRVTGNLAGSIYQVYSKDKSSPERAVYHISWNTKKAPHGHLLEYGYVRRFKVFVGPDGKWRTVKSQPLAAPVQVAAHPFVRPAAAEMPRALEAARAELVRRFGRER